MVPQQVELITAVLIGIGLSAASGFRVFVPLLGVSIAAHFGQLSLSPNFSWLGSEPALVALAFATILEIAAYTVPFIDNLVDSLTTPGAVIAGTLLMASLLGDVSPFLQWALAIIAGGGTAGLVQISSVIVRGGSSLVTGGLGNLIVGGLELIGSILLTILALLAPIFTVVGLVICLLLVFRFIYGKRLARPQQ
ncbi:DUF4126 domain-containing protein [Desulfuromonas sp. AOP6]|uniref:DUF4126 domain-containing protein n=1 Tax=Desulfuromonas sp. AOP6 TaxID=1566351 RepID=UPI001280A175|nr:DUF4126 domain-containing protein [Desulfuromonas sp. AOP6]BCA79758.1 hypothetical protein AOP6_1545 [Desulfuromonas sp. AOP6]